jgi:hypothetical protein
MVHGLIMDAGHIYIPGAGKSISRTTQIIFAQRFARYILTTEIYYQMLALKGARHYLK